MPIVFRDYECYSAESALQSIKQIVNFLHSHLISMAGINRHTSYGDTNGLFTFGVVCAHKLGLLLS